MKQRLKSFLIVMFVCPFAASLFGILHDQITYSISPEYYTHFKFLQFEFTYSHSTAVSKPRVLVALIGIMATIGFGLLTGLIVGSFGFWMKKRSPSLRIKLQSLMVVLKITLITSLIGFGIGQLVISGIFIDFIISIPALIGGQGGSPELTEAAHQVKDIKSFFLVGLIHTFSYIGGFAGIAYACFYQYRQSKKNIVITP